jgi:hypothetical protein
MADISRPVLTLAALSLADRQTHSRFRFPKMRIRSLHCAAAAGRHRRFLASLDRSPGLRAALRWRRGPDRLTS